MLEPPQNLFEPPYHRLIQWLIETAQEQNRILGIERKNAKAIDRASSNTLDAVAMQAQAIEQANESVSQVADTAWTALASADGKTTNYYSDVEPVEGDGLTFKDGDTWFDTANDNRISIWRVTYDEVEEEYVGAWELATFGTGALADEAITADKIEASVNQAIQDALSNSEAAIVADFAEYAVGPNNTTPPTTGWLPAPPAWVDGQWIWVRHLITYGSGSQVTTDPVLMTGPKGAQGPAGSDGPAGATVSTITRYFRLSATTPAAPANPPTSPWTTSEPTYVPPSTDNLYYVDRTVLSNGSSSVSAVVLSSTFQAAKDAYTLANSALTTANGKNKIVRSTADASSPGSYVAGDQWWKYSGSQITAMWLHSGSAWVTQTLTDSIITNLNAGTITAGTLNAARIGAGAITGGHIAGTTITADNMVAGTITAASGIIADAAITNAKIASLDAAKINTGTLNAARIAASSITARELAIGDFSNMALDPLMEISVAGHAWVPVSMSWGTQTGAQRSTKSWRNAAAGDWSLTSADYIPVQPGASFYLESELYRTSAGTVRLGVQWYTDTFAAIGARVDVYSGTTNNWTVQGGAVEAPANAAYAKIVYSGTGTTASGNAHVTGAMMRRMYSGELIVDGAITADKMAANSITAANGAIADLAVTNAKIADATIQSAKIANLDAGKISTGTLDADRIAANSITGGKIAADAIDGKTITGPTIRTAASGLRTQLDTVGLRTFDASNAETARLAAAAGGLALTGSLSTTSGTERATLSTGGLLLDNPSWSGGQAVTLDRSGLRSSRPGEPLDIGHDMAGTGSDVRIFTSGSNKIKLIGQVEFGGDRDWSPITFLSGWEVKNGLTVEWRVKYGWLQMRGRFGRTNNTAIGAGYVTVSAANSTLASAAATVVEISRMSPAPNVDGVGLLKIQSNGSLAAASSEIAMLPAVEWLL